MVSGVKSPGDGGAEAKHVVDVGLRSAQHTGELRGHKGIRAGCMSYPDGLFSFFFFLSIFPFHAVFGLCVCLCVF